MKWISTAALCFLVVTVFLGGCSTERASKYPRGGQFNRSMNLSQEERQQMFEEMQQKAIDACLAKNEGDSCQFDGPRGAVEGICKIGNETLACIFNGQLRQRGK